MKPITVRQLSHIIGGTVVRGNQDAVVRAVYYGQVRYLKRHHAYFFNVRKSVHKQIQAIRTVKPVVVIVPPQYQHLSIPQATAVIRVKNTYNAFWKLGLWNFRRIPGIKTIGITGSAGKSTTVAMLASMLKTKYRVVHTQNNLNTAYYLPSYLCRLSPGDQILLLEMGMNSLGNISRQCRVVRPMYGAVTNVGEAHYGSLGGSHNIIRAKQELVDGMRQGGSLFLNADDPKSRQLVTARTKANVFWFSIKRNSDLKASNIRFTQKGMSFRTNYRGISTDFHIPVFGIHNVYNALAAIGVCHAIGLPTNLVQRGLARFRQPRMRLELIHGQRRRLLINDAWNANPTAMIEGLKVLRAIAGRRQTVAVLGDMLELGSYSYTAHARVGEFIAKHPVDRLVTIGRRASIIAKRAVELGYSKEKIVRCYTLNEALKYLSTLPANSVIYFKASRKMHLEKLVKALRRS